MSKIYIRTTYLLSAVLLFVLLGGPQMAYAWTTPPAGQAASAHPVEVAVALPDAPSAQMQQVQNAQQDANNPQAAAPQPPTQDQKPAPDQKDQKKDQNPLGAAAAPAGATAGGAASRPAGTALAPAKQNQKRSLLIKLGIIAAGAAAVGAVYGLSRATGSTPPGATAH